MREAVVPGQVLKIVGVSAATGLNARALTIGQVESHIVASPTLRSIGSNLFPVDVLIQGAQSGLSSITISKILID